MKGMFEAETKLNSKKPFERQQIAVGSNSKNTLVLNL